MSELLAAHYVVLGALAVNRAARYGQPCRGRAARTDEQVARASERGRGLLLRTRASCRCEHVADGLPRAAQAATSKSRDRVTEPGGAAHRAEAAAGPRPRAG